LAHIVVCAAFESGCGGDSAPAAADPPQSDAGGPDTASHRFDGDGGVAFDTRTDTRLAEQDASSGEAHHADAADDRSNVVGGKVTLTVSMWGSGYGEVRSSPGGIACGTDCSEPFDSGSAVTLSATPALGSIFAGWSLLECGRASTCRIAMSSGRSVSAHFFHPVLLSDVDKSPDVVLSSDRLAMEQQSLGREGVRSEFAIKPRSGVYYFEARRLVQSPWMSIGVATASVPLDSTASETGQGFAIDTGDGSWFDPVSTVTYGFVVDYRLSNPVIHVIAITFIGTRVAYSIALPKVTEPLYIFLGGLRRRVGPQVAINTGNDIANFPFVYDPVTLLKQAGIAGGDQLVLGWGDSYTGLYDAPPSIAVSADQTVPLGAAVTLGGAARDDEDGDLTSKILWGDRATPRGKRISGIGGRFVFVPDAIGLHEVEASVTDAGDKTATATVRVNVTGTLPAYDPVRLVPDASSEGVVVTADGLGAHFTAPAKVAIRANQGLYRGFQYFEFHREIGPLNIGGGIVTGDGNLDPYGPHDVPPSCSVNAEGGTWRELMFSTDFTAPFKYQNNESYYGFAVDYRGASPIVYIIVGGLIVDVIALDDATVPVYPMLYGYPVSASASPDETINFGSKPFHYDPRAILKAAGIDSSALQLGWGPRAR
jgi:hypothetical protein